MRPIKFRAWSPSSKLMHGPVDVSDVAYWDRNEVILLQFTGLLDQHGKEIYEGDIVRIGYLIDGEWRDDSLHQVKWGGNYPAFELYPPVDCESNALQLYAEIQPNHESIEILGNLYEHPELVKDK